MSGSPLARLGLWLGVVRGTLGFCLLEMRSPLRARGACGEVPRGAREAGRFVRSSMSLELELGVFCGVLGLPGHCRLLASAQSESSS